MSQSDYDIDEYKSTTGAEPKIADVSDDDHALKQAFGSGKENKKFAFEAEVMAERIADWYDDPAAGLREYLSNAETACVRRARMELRDSGHDVPESTNKVLEDAKEKCDYQPTVEVTYNREPERTRLVIEDNGCGITTEEYQILRNIGYSASHGDGSRLGQFGMGVMSFLNLVGVEGMMKMSTRSFPSVDREETAYSLTMYATNMEFLNGVREEYGTRFEFPAFCEKAKSIGIRNKIEEFAEGMQVTVLYREMDENSQEVYNEDYMPRSLADDYADSALVIEFENEFFEAVISPHSPERRGYKTYNISMPIRRNTETYGSEPTFNAPWSWDFRGKSENGPIVSCTDDSLVGLSPVSSTKYDDLPDEQKEESIRREEVPDDAIVMPVPASSRDSYEGNSDEFWEYVSDCLNEQWQMLAAETLDSFDDFDDFQDADSREKHLIVRAYEQFGPGYGSSEPSTVVDTLERELDITVSKKVAKKLDRLTDSQLVVRRGSSNPSYKSATNSRKTWKIIDNSSGGTVYMAKTVSPKKAEIAWELDDENTIVRLEDDDYDELEELWGWEKLKDIPTRNIKEKLPSLDDDIAEKFEQKSSSDYKSNSTKKGSTRTSRNPKTKKLKVYGKSRRSRRSFSTKSAEYIYDKMDNGDTVSAGYRDADKVIAFDTNETSIGKAKRSINGPANTAVVVAPKYVYKYLIDADNVYESEEEIRKEERKNATVELSGGREVNIRNLPDDELILIDASTLKKRFGDDKQTLLDWVNETLDEDYSNLSFLSSDDFNQYHWTDPSGGTIRRFSGYRGLGSRMRANGSDISEGDIIKAILTPDNIDWNHDFMQAINKRGRVKNDADRTMDVVEYLRKHDALPTE